MLYTTCFAWVADSMQWLNGFVLSGIFCFSVFVRIFETQTYLITICVQFRLAYFAFLLWSLIISRHTVKLSMFVGEETLSKPDEDSRMLFARFQGPKELDHHTSNIRRKSEVIFHRIWTCLNIFDNEHILLSMF